MDELTIIILIFPESHCAHWSISTCPRWLGSFQTLSSWSQSPQRASLIIRTEICPPSLFITKERWRRSSSGRSCSEEWTLSAMVRLCVCLCLCPCGLIVALLSFRIKKCNFVLFLRAGMASGRIRCREDRLGRKSKETDPGPADFIHPLLSAQPQRQRWIWRRLIWCNFCFYFSGSCLNFFGSQGLFFFSGLKV